MKAKILLTAVSAAALAACVDVSGSNGFVCRTEAPQVVAPRGDTTVTAIGLKWLDTQVGTGTQVAACDGVGIYYRGYVAGRAAPYDSLVRGNPRRFVAGGGEIIVTGVDVGVIGMKQGGRRRLIIPPSLGLGSIDRLDPAGNVVVPANSTLIFDVEMVEVTPQDD